MAAGRGLWLQDKVVLVTGGAGGIGRATALLAADEGANIVIADLNREGGQETVNLVIDKGRKALFVEANVAKNDDVMRVVESAVAEFGHIDCLVNNAAIGGEIGKVTYQSEDMFDRLTEIDLKGPFLCMKHVVAQMLLQRGCDNLSIVNVASFAGIRAFANNAPYSAVKHGVTGLTKSVGIEYARKGIRVNAVCPSFVDTNMLVESSGPSQAAKDKLGSRVPLGRVAEPNEVASVIVFLLSPAASYITAECIAVTGGLAAL